MSVLAFLQNAHTSSEEQARELEEQFADPRLKSWMQSIRKYGLFAGRNYTGLTIKRVFGEMLCESIWWENASPKWGWKSNHAFPADLDHMRRLCEERVPVVVLAFGKVASEAARDLQGQFDSPIAHSVVICGPHPAARHPSKWDELREMHRRLLDEARFDECQHCHLLTCGGSHCSHCCKSLGWEPDSEEVES